MKQLDETVRLTEDALCNLKHLDFMCLDDAINLLEMVLERLKDERDERAA